jgi:DNA repair protein RecN (Recombination protein N)
MLKSLSVRNYALITSLDVEFREGLNMITGETGAGKSILIGALGLLLGNRADTQVLRDKDQKCLIEATFVISGLKIQDFFAANDLDYEDQTTIRREITPQGKSRAFINDTPVTLPVIKELTANLVDIHSQHQNLLLNDPGFAIHTIDRFGQLTGLTADYAVTFDVYKEMMLRLDQLRQKLDHARSDQDYLEFQLKQLDQAALKEDELETLEQEQEKLEHAGEIRTRLGESVEALHESEEAIETRLKQVITALQSIVPYLPEATEPADRLQSSYIEIQETARELNRLLGQTQANPERLSEVINRLDLINNLLKKHQSSTEGDLITLRDEFRERLVAIETSDEEIKKCEAKLEQIRQQLISRGDSLSRARQKVLSGFEKRVTELMKELGMPSGSFKAAMDPLTEFSSLGRDAIRFLFSANKNQQPEELSRVASGGETSRLMLSLKSLISDSLEIPTVIFDEIDSGVSGEIANRVGNLIARLSSGRQILNITHLPQVASKGDHHYLVYKYDDDHTTHTSIRLLDPEERIMELAKMLSGEKVTEEAVNNAKVLLSR